MLHRKSSDASGHHHTFGLSTGLVSELLMAAGISLGSSVADAAGTYCTDTAKLVYRACGFEKQDEYSLSLAKCLNESDKADRNECNTEASAARDEENALCKEQFLGRVAACKLLGEKRYDPPFEPQMFDTNFAHLTRPNPYFPLRIGNTWEYAGGTETSTLEVLNQTKLIDEVRCIVVRDLVYDKGILKEGTDDWYAQAKDGNVWYCGEEVKNYENFEGDEPRLPELVSIDGRFKADVDRDKPGIIFQARPTEGQVYVEEFSLGNAEDVTIILSANYSYGNDKELDRFVPARLAQLLCKNDCVVTENFSLLEPGVTGHKYYARGVGIFLETDPDTGEISQLINCNFDTRCRSLPHP
jgi:hypothetical protein